jgi:hypothetical protein
LCVRNERRTQTAWTAAGLFRRALRAFGSADATGITAPGDELNSADNPLNYLCDEEVMRRAFAVVRHGVGTDTQIHKFLWTYLFTILWLRGTAP